MNLQIWLKGSCFCYEENKKIENTTIFLYNYLKTISLLLSYATICALA